MLFDITACVLKVLIDHPACYLVNHCAENKVQTFPSFADLNETSKKSSKWHIWFRTFLCTSKTSQVCLTDIRMHVMHRWRTRSTEHLKTSDESLKEENIEAFCAVSTCDHKTKIKSNPYAISSGHRKPIWDDNTSCNQSLTPHNSLFPLLYPQ